jgi:hypothetical protein
VARKGFLVIFATRKFLHSVKKDFLHSKQAEKNRIQRKRDSSVSVKFKNSGIQRKSADDPFNFEKIENFWHSAEFWGLRQRWGSGII